MESLIKQVNETLYELSSKLYQAVDGESAHQQAGAGMGAGAGASGCQQLKGTKQKVGADEDVVDVDYKEMD